MCSLQVQAVPVSIVEPDPSLLSSPSLSSTDQVNDSVLFEQVNMLQQEVLKLRGLLEEQANALRRLSQENRDRYLDLDRRINVRLQPDTTKKDQSPASVVRETGGLSDGADIDDGLPDVVTDQEVYQGAYRLIRSREFDEAVVALRGYISRFPAGRYIDNAQYWLGEVYFAQSKFKESRDAFKYMLTHYPSSSKLPDAIYKLGRVFDHLNDKEQSEKYLNAVITQYPKSSAAKLADVYLRSR
ncbi:MAG: tol-pal system protein YbgF [Endozoicomonadaceae bacterium]|nr:tol-pal system protein YbgF [Endozoicomonadaceae bacterium]